MGKIFNEKLVTRVNEPKFCTDVEINKKYFDRPHDGTGRIECKSFDLLSQDMLRFDAGSINACGEGLNSTLYSSSDIILNPKINNWFHCYITFVDTVTKWHKQHMSALPVNIESRGSIDIFSEEGKINVLHTNVKAGNDISVKALNDISFLNYVENDYREHLKVVKSWGAKWGLELDNSVNPSITAQGDITFGVQENTFGAPSLCSSSCNSIACVSTFPTMMHIVLIGARFP
jgi:hypothetical protein